jgi:Winged helix-turn helix
MNNRQLALNSGTRTSNALRNPRKLGRRTILNAKLTKTLCDLLAAGNSIRTACEAVGIDESTFHDWIARSEQGEKQFIEFSKRTGAARAKAKKRLVKVLVKASPKDWRAAAWLLSHCWPQEFSEIVRSEVGLLGGVILMPAKESKEP